METSERALTTSGIILLHTLTITEQPYRTRSNTKSDRRNANNYSPKVAQEKCIFSPKISIFSKTKIFLAKLRPSSRRHCPSPSSCQFSPQSFASSNNFWSINCEVVVAPCEATSVLLWTLRAQTTCP